MIRQDGKHHAFILKPLYCDYQLEKQQQIYDLTKRASLVLERIIRKYPDEWLWTQKRWNTKYL